MTAADMAEEPPEAITRAPALDIRPCSKRFVRGDFKVNVKIY